MALPSSGPISLNDIWDELGNPPELGPVLSLEAMSTWSGINQYSTSKPDGVAPHSISEWYDYDHSTPPPPPAPPTWVGADGSSGTHVDCTWSNGGNNTDPIDFQYKRSGVWNDIGASPLAAGTEAHDWTSTPTYNPATDDMVRIRFNDGSNPSNWAEILIST